MFMGMKLTLLLFMYSTAAKLEIDGEVSFSVNIPGGGGGGAGVRAGSQVTAGSVVECVYQYPEQKQVDAILSNMMNVLTKVFVRSSELYMRVSGRREEEHIPETRFQVVDKKKTQYFESIYHNMTDEYNKMYNSSAARARVDRAGWDPCEHQPEMKQMWRELLDRSLATCRRALVRCMEEQLRPRRADRRLRARLNQLLARELVKARAAQLHLLCDHFQLCYNDLL